MDRHLSPALDDMVSKGFHVQVSTACLAPTHVCHPYQLSTFGLICVVAPLRLPSSGGPRGCSRIVGVCLCFVLCWHRARLAFVAHLLPCTCAFAMLCSRLCSQCFPPRPSRITTLWQPVSSRRATASSTSMDECGCVLLGCIVAHACFLLLRGGFSLSSELRSLHVLVCSNMYDPVFNETFTRATSTAKWWGGEPVWVTAQIQGRRTAIQWPVRALVTVISVVLSARVC